MKKHVMVDLETLGGAPDGRILSIGACRFDPHQGWEEPASTELFYRAVDPKNSVGRIDADTVCWWMEQEDSVRREAFSGKLLLTNVLVEFIQFCEGADRLWSNGPTFDEMILRHAFKQSRLEFPFHYKASRCMRTLKTLAGELGLNVSILENENKHNALADAIHQARLVSMLIQEMRKSNGS